MELPADGDLFCLMGADSLGGLRQWHRAEEIPFAAEIIVASRPGQSLDDLKALLPEGLNAGSGGLRERCDRSTLEVRYSIGDGAKVEWPSFYSAAGVGGGDQRDGYS